MHYIYKLLKAGGVKAKVRLPTCGQKPRLVGIASDFITFCGAPTGALDARRTTKSAFSFARRCGIRQKSGMYWRFALDWVPTRRGFVPPSLKCVRSRAIERAMRLCGLRFCGDEHSCPPRLLLSCGRFAHVHTFLAAAMPLPLPACPTLGYHVIR